VTRIDHLTSARIDTPVKLVSDGARLYYMERDGDHWNLMETAVSGGEGQRVETGATSALAMDVSPDFSELLIGTFETRGEPNRLWTIPVQGGAPMRLGDATAASAVFSPDGKQIAYLSGADLWMMDANGSNPHRLAAMPGAPSWLAWSPDGKRLDSRSGAVKETRLWRYRVREGIFTNCYRTGHIPQASAVAPGLPTVVISFSIHLALGGRISGLCAKKAPRGAEVREARFS
jgi:Tol biopolymer transport system component